MVSWKKYWSGVGVSGLIVIGALLFFFPEPLTSFLGVVLILTAALIWLAGWYRDRSTTTTDYAETDDY